MARICRPWRDYFVPLQARNTETELWCQITSVLQEYIQMTDFRKCVYAFLDLKPLEDEKVYTDD